MAYRAHNKPQTPLKIESASSTSLCALSEEKNPEMLNKHGVLAPDSRLPAGKEQIKAPVKPRFVCWWAWRGADVAALSPEPTSPTVVPT